MNKYKIVVMMIPFADFQGSTNRYLSLISLNNWIHKFRKC